MNIIDNHESSPEGGERLLQELMPKLGLETAQPGGRYKRQARAGYILPRVLAVCLLAGLLAVLVTCLLLPVQFRDVAVTEAPSGATVDFRVGRRWLLESVTAVQDGAPVPVELLDMGVYRLETARNGRLVVTARTFTDRITQWETAVDCVDKEPPHIDHDEVVDGQMCIYLTDGENGSGIAWETLRATYAGSGESFQVDEIDQQALCVRFLFPSENVRLYVEDNNGNPLSMLLEPGASADA